MPEKRNPLLDEAIEKQIKEARYVEPKKNKQRRNYFYLTIIFLVTLAVILSLLRYL
ncbi:TPA: hypothetical protein ACGO9Z_000544 [Streptococcus suis]|nr:hypothetical protein [Streptococcus suis]NQM38982.1 hypothetical protein [Streptococcus suis]